MYRPAVSIASLALAAVLAVSCTDRPDGPLAPGINAAASLLGGTPRGTELQITTSIATQEWPAISGDAIIWIDTDSSAPSARDLYLYGIGTGVQLPVVNDVPMGWPFGADVSGGRVVWHDSRSGHSAIYLYDGSTAVQTRISESGAAYSPSISGDRVVWQDLRSGNYDIYMYDIGSGQEVQLTSSSGHERYPAISGSRVVWQDDRNGNYDIYLYDLSTGIESQITSDPTSQTEPDISGDIVVWQDYRHGNWDVYMYDVVKGEERQITTDAETQAKAAVSGDRIVWVDFRNGNWDIYGYQVSSGLEFPVVTDPSRQGNPDISGDRIVWEDWRNGNDNGDIYLYDLGAPTNHPPIANAGDNQAVLEGAVVTLDASESSDADGDVINYSWDPGDGSGVISGAGPTTTHRYRDNGQYTATVTVSDGGLQDTDDVTIEVQNVAPVLFLPTTGLTPDPIPVAASFDLALTFTDPGLDDTHTAAISWGDGSKSVGTVNFSTTMGTGTLEASHDWATPGIYTVQVEITDDDGGSDLQTAAEVVVYDPSGGFVAGAGRFESPPGAYSWDKSASGPASFGFQSRYLPGAQTPTGNAGFRFKAGDFEFNSVRYEWLVVNQAGTNAQFKGEGTINGAQPQIGGYYKFMIWATDGGRAGPSFPDAFRIRIWLEAGSEEMVVYDGGSSIGPYGAGTGQVQVQKN